MWRTNALRSLLFYLAVIGVAVFGTMIAHSDKAAFSAGLSTAMLFSALVLALCIAVNLYAASDQRQ